MGGQPLARHVIVCYVIAVACSACASSPPPDEDTSSACLGPSSWEERDLAASESLCQWVPLREPPRPHPEHKDDASIVECDA